MDIHNLKNCISHDEATIQSFIRDPQYADFYLHAVLADGNPEEISNAEALYTEAQRRREYELSYWNDVVHKAHQAVREGHNLRLIYSLLADATSTVKAAMA